MMNTPTRIIHSLAKLLKENSQVFTPEISENLTALQNSINSLSNPDDKQLAKVILNWIKPYESLKTAIRQELNRVIATEENQIIPDKDRRNGVGKLNNQTLLSESIEEFQKNYLGKSPQK